MTAVQVGVGVFVLRDGRFLMGRRRGAHGAGAWSLPGGHLEYGETFETTATREVAEETGLTIRNLRFAAVTNDLFPTEARHYVTIWLLSDLASGEPTVREPDKYVDLRWHTFDDLPTPLFQPWHQLLTSPFLPALKAATVA